MKTKLGQTLISKLASPGKPAEQREHTPPLRMFKAKVDAIAPHLTIAYDGATGIRVSRNANYTPVIGDSVMVLQQGASVIVNCKINNG